MKIVLICVYLILTVSGLILMKLGGNTGTLSLSSGIMNFGISVISLTGLLCYLGSFLLFTRLVVMFNLSYIMPLCTGIVQILSLVASKLVFKENISTTGVIGASLVIIGIIVMNLKNAN